MAALLVVAITAFAAAPALAKSSAGQSSLNPIVKACEKNGDQLTGHYSLGQLQQALNSIPPAIQEYTTCAQVLTNAIDAATSGGKLHDEGKSSGGGFPVLVVAIIVILAIGAGASLYSYRRSRSDGGR